MMSVRSMWGKQWCVLVGGGGSVKEGGLRRCPRARRHAAE